MKIHNLCFTNSDCCDVNVMSHIFLQLYFNIMLYYMYIVYSYIFHFVICQLLYMCLLVFLPFCTTSPFLTNIPLNKPTWLPSQNVWEALFEFWTESTLDFPLVFSYPVTDFHVEQEMWFSVHLIGLLGIQGVHHPTVFCQSPI